MNKNQNGFGIAGVLAVTAVIAIVCALGWLFVQNFINKPESVSTTDDTSTVPTKDVPMVMPPTAPLAE